jgi:hypothetical protein
MSTSAQTVTRQGTARISAWVGLVLAFAIGTASGAVAVTVIADRAIVGGAPAVELPPTQGELKSMIQKAELAASRGDVRLYLQFRDDIAASVGSAQIAEQLTHLAAKADAAASRGDVRLSLQFREDLADSIAALAGGE